jgi:hypothetical protein
MSESSQQIAEFVPYGTEWQKEMMQFPKAAMIERCAEIIQTKETRIEELTKALEHYADQLNWDWHGDSHTVYRYGRINECSGTDIADAALKGGRDASKQD